VSIDKKESNRWLAPSIETRDETLKQAAHITFVMDREGDIIQVLDQLPNHRSDVAGGKQTRLKGYLKTKALSGKYKIKIRSPKGKSKQLKVSLKYGAIKILAPSRGYKMWAPLDYHVVEVKEYRKRKKPIHWIILTSKKIESDEEALEIISIYKRRWKIEVFFKRLKSDGYNIEKTALETGKGIRKLTLLLTRTIKISQKRKNSY